MFSTRIRALVRQQWAGLIALFLVLTGGVAVASHPGGVNTINSADIIDGEVKEADVGQGAVASPEVKNNSIVGGDVAPNSLATGKIVDGSLTGVDVANNSLKGADVDESTLDVGDAARAYARVSPDCDILSNCPTDQSKGISNVTREATGQYCVTAPGIDSAETPAAVTVDAGSTGASGDASAVTFEAFGCGPGQEGFLVLTERHTSVLVNSGAGTNNASASGPSEDANGVGFTIVIP
jgi:hypothetical protein